MTKIARIFKSVILGAPASGKGTISDLIVKNFSIKHISSGDELRRNIQNNTPIGAMASKYIQEGKLVPDEVMIKFIICELDKVPNQHWLLDGFPRTLSQTKALWDIEELDLALYLNVPFPIIIERVKGRRVHLPSGRVYNEKFNAPKVAGKDDVTGEPLVQRDDDKPEVVLKRLEQYEQLTGPVIEFYRQKEILKEFAGEKSDELWSNIKDCLSRYLSPKCPKRK